MWEALCLLLYSENLTLCLKNLEIPSLKYTHLLFSQLSSTSPSSSADPSFKCSLKLCSPLTLFQSQSIPSRWSFLSWIVISHCSGQRNAPTRYPHLTPVTCGYVTLHGKGHQMGLKILRWGDYLDCRLRHAGPQGQAQGFWVVFTVDLVQTHLYLLQCQLPLYLALS